MRRTVVSCSLLVCYLYVPIALAQEGVLPRGHTKPPGPPVPAHEAATKMTVPEGFTVEVVASEPDIVNPVAMAIDERGRFWITESLEYPRREPGPGRDRVKVLEDSDGDGKADKFTVFAQGLNIPSGIAVGHGGVWVANAPDILFMQDTDGDGRADKQEVVVTGFGRTDTHELPNSLTWGPDGWLYGLNGVFNHSHVRYPKTSTHYREEHPGWKFTCAMFRIHPRTREFQVFCEGTSNPWGIAFDTEGSAFVSACVIDHLWHLTESGYYHRQGGPYPPFTWKIESIVKHKHQKAAYCGIHYFDSDAYPPEYRERLYMGNIHGGCVNVDRLERDGSTYFGTGEPDFLTANDVWFMPVVQKTGPDGSLYVLDWYDRYHCYQDANRDPQGIDRLKGRLYRVRYKETPRAVGFDLSQESYNELLGRLRAGNDFIRHTAQRILAERQWDAADQVQPTELQRRLEQIALSDEVPRKQRLHAVWALIGGGCRADLGAGEALLKEKDPTLRAWGVRWMANQQHLDDAYVPRILALAKDPAPEVKLQVAIAARKLDGIDPLPILVQVLEASGNDKLIPHIVWQNLYPLLEQESDAFVAEVAKRNLEEAPALAALLPRAVDCLLGHEKANVGAAAALFQLLAKSQPATTDGARACLVALAQRVESRELSGDKLHQLRSSLGDSLTPILAGDPQHPLYLPAAALASSWNDAKAIEGLARIFRDAQRAEADRLAALGALVSAGHPGLLAEVLMVLNQPGHGSSEFRGAALSALGKLDSNEVATSVLDLYPRFEPELRPRAIELLTQRATWSRLLVAQVGARSIPASALNVNQLRKLLSFNDPKLNEAVAKHWGTVRTERDPKREAFLGEMRKLIEKTPGDAHKGKLVYTRVCGQCHKLNGEGQEVGPDITNNGRGSFEQLLSNVFDPSLVIGASYQARTVLTADGRVLTGLLVEDNDQRLVLKGQGGKLETIPRSEVDEVKVSELSLMPEGLEKQLQPQEIVDLFAYLLEDASTTAATKLGE